VIYPDYSSYLSRCRTVPLKGKPGQRLSCVLARAIAETCCAISARPTAEVQESRSALYTLFQYVRIEVTTVVQRVNDNLLGNRFYWPVVHRTEAVKNFMVKNLAREVPNLVDGSDGPSTEQGATHDSSPRISLRARSSEGPNGPCPTRSGKPSGPRACACLRALVRHGTLPR
jgi:hypothetical protein